MQVLISPSSFGEISETPLDILAKAGFSYINNPYKRKLTENEVIELAANATGIIAGVEPLTARVMDALPSLRCISRVGVGMESVDLAYAASKGISVVNTPDGPTRAVAELTLGMTLSLLRKIPQADANLKQKVWKKETGNLLFGKTVGVVGLGRIGKMVAGQFRALGNKVIGFDLYPDHEWAKQQDVVIGDLDAVLQEADIITLHIPGNKDKSPAIGAAQMELCKDGAFLINISRGDLVHEDALFDALSSGKLAGAAIDVFPQEPYSGKLCDLYNIVLTPHIGSYAKEGKLQMEIDATNNLINILKS